MKKLGVSIIALAPILLAAYGGALAVSHKLDSEAENAVSLYVSKINKYKKSNGRYPDTLDEINIKRVKIFFILSPSAIRYIKGDVIELYYTQFPLGPKHVYNLIEKVWSFEE